jgi:dephospho-CoA kinase
MQRQNHNKSYPLAKRQGKTKLILGITGSFGSGKTTVAKIFKSYKAEVIDADKLAHNCIKRGAQAYKRMVAIFGKDILKKNRVIDRRKLSRVVFNKKNLLRRLNNIVHPQVIRIIKSRIKQSRARLIVLDAPLLIEADLKKIVDKLIVVKATQSAQIKRIQKRSPLSSRDILKRIRSQIPLRLKERLADFVIDNSGTLKRTRKQVRQIRRLLWKN